MTAEKPAGSTSNAAFGVACSIVLLVSGLGLLGSLFGVLFGPDWLIKFGVLGFLLTVATSALSMWFPPAQPKGLSASLPPLLKLQTPATWASRIFKLAMIVSILTMFLSARLDGVTSGGSSVFAPREKYELQSHGRKTEVSKLRYWIVGGSFAAGWHSGALYFSVMSMGTFLFGAGWFKTKATNAETQRS